MNFFTHEQVSERIFRIRDISGTAVYLLSGDQKTALLDTGIGIGSLKEYIYTSFLKTADLIILMHGHLDHVNGAAEFYGVPVYLHPADRPLMRRHTDAGKRLQYVRQNAAYTGAEISAVSRDEMILAFDPEETLPLSDGQIFDLGGLTVEAIHTPGHTQGMSMLLLREERTILFGDGCGVGVLLIEDCASTVTEYRRSLKKVKTYEACYDRILRNHGTCSSSKELLDNVIDVCEELLAGKDDHIPVKEAPLACREQIYLAKAVRPGTQLRLDGKEGNVMYIKSKI